MNCLSGVIVGMLISSAEIRGFDPRTGQTKEIKLVLRSIRSKFTNYGVSEGRGVNSGAIVS